MRETFATRAKRFLKMFPKLISEFFNQASIQGSKSTVLRPLGWLVSICSAGLLGAVYGKVPSWVGIIFASALSASVLLYIGAYIFCLFVDRDALRSETYSIQKLAIERGFVGDSLSGTFKQEIEKGEGATRVIAGPGTATEQ